MERIYIGDRIHHVIYIYIYIYIVVLVLISSIFLCSTKIVLRL